MFNFTRQKRAFVFKSNLGHELALAGSKQIIKRLCIFPLVERKMGHLEFERWNTLNYIKWNTHLKIKNCLFI